MKNTIFFILLSLIFGASVEGKSTTAKLSYKSFSRIPVLAEGRIKPLDTFARTNLLLVHEKSSLKKMSAIEWLAELLLDPPTAYQRKIFKIRNSDVIKALSLESDPSHNYSFIEVSSAVNREQNLVSEIARIPQKDQTPTQRQIYQLHHKVIKIFNISRSFSLLAPQFKIPNEDFANILELPFGQSLNYLQLQKRKNQFTELAAKIINNKKGNFSEDEQKLLDMGRKLEYIAADSMSSELRIVPPQFYKPRIGNGSPLANHTARPRLSADGQVFQALERSSFSL